jgi:hypothetical protein
MTLGKWVKNARNSGQVPGKDLAEPERADIEPAWSLYSWVKCRRVATQVPPLRSAAVYDRVSTRSGTVQLG